MNSTWQSFLTRHGARFDGERLTGFERHPAADAVASLTDLSGEGIVAVEGPDARTFLQGQLSTDIDALTPETSQLSSWSSSKGRVVTVLRVLQRGDTILLLLPRSLLAPFLKRFSMYVLRAKVRLNDASDHLVHLGLAGHTAERMLQSAGLPFPASVNSVTTTGQIQIVRLHGIDPRFLVLGSPDAMMEVWEKLGTAGAIPMTDNDWALRKIQAGEPTIVPGTSEHFVAQMIGLEELGAINFKKGCYIGQEIIARAHFRGTVKRHMLHARCESGDAVLPGTAIENIETGQVVAEVIDSRQNQDGIQEMLVVIQDDHRNAALKLAGDDRHIIIIQPI